MIGLKQILRHDWIRVALGVILAAYIRLVFVTSRWRIEGGEHPARLWDEGKPFLLAFWHGRLLLMPYCWRKGMPLRMLISQHPDGRFIAHTIRHFGFEAVTGSSSRGGAAALRVILKSLEDNVSIGFTPDGPRGPRMRASVGIIQAARLAGVPILPCAVATSRRRVIRSWDRFALALPFSRGAFLWDEPITVSRNASDEEIEAARLQLEERLNAITAAADRLLGAEPVEPDAISDTATTKDKKEAARTVAARR